MPELNYWERERNTAMKVFSRLYLGLKDQSRDIPLGFATPYEDNAAGRKRQETVDRWAGGYGEWVNGKHVPGVPKTRIMDNEPREGFKITDDIKRVYWGGGNVVWRVLDPAGFELEIQSRNLMAIIQSCGINEGGEIPGRCIWGRSGGDNILLHESSDEYKDAAKAAETLKAPKQVGKNARRVGGIYRRVDGSPAIFIGKVHVTRAQYAENKFEQLSSSEQGPLSYVMLPQGRCIVSKTELDILPSEPFEAMLEIMSDDKGGYTLTKNLTLYKKAPCVDDLGDAKIEKVTNRWLLTLNWAFASKSISAVRIIGVTVDPILNPEPALTPITDAQFAEMMRNVKQYIKQNCKRDGSYSYRLPLHLMLSAYKRETVMHLDGKLWGAISPIGADYGAGAKTASTYDIALPVTFNTGCMVWVDGTDHSNRFLTGNDQWYYNSRIDARSQQFEHRVMPKFETPEELYAYMTTLFNGDQLLYVTVKEAQ